MTHTEPLKNGAKLPEYPSDTNAKKITEYLTVRDAENGKQLSAGLHRSEVELLKLGIPILPHMYRYQIAGGVIYHTRPAVVVEVSCDPVE